MRTLLTDPIRLLRLEGLAVLVVVLVAYGTLGLSWWAFVAIVLLPDLSMLAYARGPQAGAHVYNLAHTSPVPLGLTLVGVLAASDGALLVGLAWLAHIALDRAVGYGLKLPTSFHDTHLGRIGRGRRGTPRPPGTCAGGGGGGAGPRVACVRRPPHVPHVDDVVGVPPHQGQAPTAPPHLFHEPARHRCGTRRASRRPRSDPPAPRRRPACQR